MYAAVYHFGPRWGAPTLRSLKDDEDFLRMRKYIQDNSSISLDAIEKLTSDFLKKLIPVVPPPIRIPPRSIRRLAEASPNFRLHPTAASARWG
jgi:hypothetical protein